METYKSEKKVLTTENLSAIFQEVKSYVDATPGCNCPGDGGGGVGIPILSKQEFENLGNDHGYKTGQVIAVVANNSQAVAPIDPSTPELHSVDDAATITQPGLGEASIYNGATVKFYYWDGSNWRNFNLLSDEEYRKLKDINVAYPSSEIILSEIDTDEILTATATTPVNFDHQTFNAIIQKCVQACEANTKPKLKMAYDGVYTRYCEILSMTFGEDKDYVYLDVVCDGKLYTIRLTGDKGYATLNSSGAPALDYATTTEVETEADKVFTNNK